MFLVRCLGCELLYEENAEQACPRCGRKEKP